MLKSYFILDMQFPPEWVSFVLFSPFFAKEKVITEVMSKKSISSISYIHCVSPILVSTGQDSFSLLLPFECPFDKPEEIDSVKFITIISKATK